MIMPHMLSTPHLDNVLSQRLGSRLSAQEFRRRLWHFMPGAIALTIPLVPHQEVVRLWVMLLMVGLLIILPALAAIRYQRMYARHGEQDCSASIFGYVLPLSLMALLFRGQLELPLAVTAIISFGDGSATLTGLLTRGARLPWNRQKSWAGMMAFILIGTIMASLLYWAEADPAVSIFQALVIVGPVAALCAVVESLPLKANDNITVGWVAALLMVLQQTLLVGWN
jgi:dolichol kinase